MFEFFQWHAGSLRTAIIAPWTIDYEIGHEAMLSHGTKHRSVLPPAFKLENLILLDTGNPLAKKLWLVRTSHSTSCTNG
jgi:hypothetical protein